MLVTSQGTDLPYVLFWIGLGLAMAAGVLYVASAFRRTHEGRRHGRGKGTRLRPLTSNQPKPMVPIVGKPCMEHILELSRRHGIEDVIVTVAFLPQPIRSYFGTAARSG